MDALRFDRLARSIASRFSRRRTLRALTAGLIAATLGQAGHEPAAAATCRAIGKSCKKRPGKPKPKCCRGSVCRGNTCRCKPGRKQCGKRCLPRTQCCTNNDCPRNQRCDRKTRRCGCGKQQKRCQNLCIAEEQCCTAADCPAFETCNAAHACVARDCTSNADCSPGACNCSPEAGPEVPGSGTCQAPTFSQPFTETTDGWYAFDDGTFSDPATILTIDGGEGLLAPTPSAGLTAASPLGGYSDLLPEGGFTTSIEIYLDPELPEPDSERFTYVLDILQVGTCALEEAAHAATFNGGFDAGGAFCVGTGGSVGVDPCILSQKASVESAGWYRFTYAATFIEVGGLPDHFVIFITVRRLSDNVVILDTNVSLGPDTDLGGNGKVHFKQNSFDGLRIRNSTRTNGNAN